MPRRPRRSSGVRDRDLHVRTFSRARGRGRGRERERRLSARPASPRSPGTQHPGPRAEGLLAASFAASVSTCWARARGVAARGDLPGKPRLTNRSPHRRGARPRDRPPSGRFGRSSRPGLAFRPKKRRCGAQRRLVDGLLGLSAAAERVAARFSRSCIVSSSIPQREGFSRRIGEIVDLSISRSDASVKARTVALRGSPVSRLISPNAAPGSRTARRWLDPTLPWTETPSRPASTTNMDDPRSPSRTIVSPAANRLSRAPSQRSPRFVGEEREEIDARDRRLDGVAPGRGVSAPPDPCHCRINGTRTGSSRGRGGTRLSPDSRVDLGKRA